MQTGFEIPSWVVSFHDAELLVVLPSSLIGFLMDDE